MPSTEELLKLANQCRAQAKMTQAQQTKDVLLKMAMEYEQRAQSKKAE